jgi:molecular chaperone DnaJ
VIEAVLGTKLKYKTVWGERVLAIKGGVQDGEVIKRSGEGCKKKSNKDKGHHFITVSVTIPISISEEEMGIYERIRDIVRNKKKGY